MNYLFLIILYIFPIIVYSQQDSLNLDQYSDEYYYDDYYDDETQKVPEVPEVSEKHYSPEISSSQGFPDSIGIKRSTDIVVPLSNKEFITLIASRFGCLTRSQILNPTFENLFGPNYRNYYQEEKAKLQKRRDEYIKSLKDKLKSTQTIEDNSNEIIESEPTIKRRKNTKEIQEEKARKRLEMKEIEKQEKVKYPLGSDCEGLICGACKNIVVEFSREVLSAYRNPQISSIEQVLSTLCEAREMNLRNGDLAIETCNVIRSNVIGYYNALLGPFENEINYLSIMSPSKVFENQKNICTTIGACDSSNFEFRSTPLSFKEAHWEKECYVCQIFASNIQDRVQLSRHLTEKTMIPLIKETCDLLNLPNEYNNICQNMLKPGKLFDDIAWMTKVNDESIKRKEKSERRFGDILCEEINYCQKYVDPEVMEQQKVVEDIGALYF